MLVLHQTLQVPLARASRRRASAHAAPGHAGNDAISAFPLLRIDWRAELPPEELDNHTVPRFVVHTSTSFRCLCCGLLALLARLDIAASFSSMSSFCASSRRFVCGGFLLSCFCFVPVWQRPCLRRDLSRMAPQACSRPSRRSLRASFATQNTSCHPPSRGGHCWRRQHGERRALAA